MQNFSKTEQRKATILLARSVKLKSKTMLKNQIYNVFTLIN